jgi:hypothetical protein
MPSTQSKESQQRIGVSNHNDMSSPTACSKFLGKAHHFSPMLITFSCASEHWAGHELHSRIGRIHLGHQRLPSERLCSTNSRPQYGASACKTAPPPGNPTSLHSIDYPSNQLLSYFGFPSKSISTVISIVSSNSKYYWDQALGSLWQWRGWARERERRDAAPSCRLLPLPGSPYSPPLAGALSNQPCRYS